VGSDCAVSERRVQRHPQEKTFAPAVIC